jgi:hypothetical protein
LYFRRFPAGARVAEVGLRPEGSLDPAGLDEAAHTCVVLRVTPREHMPLVM